jgi:hypothetical protein
MRSAVTNRSSYYAWLAELKEKNKARSEQPYASSFLVPRGGQNFLPAEPKKITADGIINAYKRACGELPDPLPLDPNSPAAAIVRAYRKACGEVVEEPDEPTGLAASRARGEIL